MADDGTPRNIHAAPSRNTRRSNEGGRPVNMETGRNALGYTVAQDPMRAEADAGMGIPGADGDEGVLGMVNAAAEQIARLHPDHQKRVDSVAAKLKAAVAALG